MPGSVEIQADGNRVGGAGTMLFRGDGLYQWIAGTLVGGTAGQPGSGQILNQRDRFEIVSRPGSTNVKILEGLFGNSGTVRHRSGVVQLATGAVLRNNGTYNFDAETANDTLSIVAAPGAASPVFESGGTLRQVGSGFARIAVPVRFTGGEVHVSNRALSFSAGGVSPGRPGFFVNAGGLLGRLELEAGPPPQSTLYEFQAGFTARGDGAMVVEPAVEVRVRRVCLGRRAAR
jgi:hypothetical protein